PRTRGRAHHGRRRRRGLLPGVLRRARPDRARHVSPTPGPGSFVIDKIYLVGFMAAGKTTVARLLAARLGWRAEDIDELIEARERMRVSDIFARFGEPHFPSIEREMLHLVLPLRHSVVATGGGTFMDPENRQAINMDGVSVWMEVRLDT